MAAEWLKIKNEYINGSISYRKLAEKYGVSVDAVKKKAAAEHWKDMRTKAAPILHQKVQEKCIEKIATSEANRIVSLLSLSDKLSAQLDRAIGELDSRVVTNTTKVKTIVYGNSASPCKPTKETVIEKEDCEVVQTLIDRQGLQQLSAALKNIKDTVTVLDTAGSEVQDDGFLAALNAQTESLWNADAPDDSSVDWEDTT